LSGQIVKRHSLAARAVQAWCLRQKGIDSAFMLTAQSLLFVPGHRPDRFGKAAAAGAGLTVIDLEDAVPAADKPAARSAALAQFGEAGAALPAWGLRINPVTTAAGIADLAVLGEAAVLPPVLLIPMVENPIELKIVANALGSRAPGLVPLIETPAGLRVAHQIGKAPCVIALMFGGGDFSAELGVALAWEPLVAAKAAIHPAQLPAIHQAFQPTDAEVAEAREALAAYAAGGGQAIRFKGRMLEAPFIRRYQAVLEARNRKSHA
jgi:citrate lyase subunit beta/citryl-CoA lyase/(S)-citramalyl-CoA lyase